MLARTGMRRGELLGLTIDAVVQIGSAFWLRTPVGKLHNDRYIPLHPQLKTLLDEWLAERPPTLRTDLMFCDRGRPIPAQRVDRAVQRAAAAAGLGHVHPHQLRHTLATQAINRGMSLEAIAALYQTQDPRHDHGLRPQRMLGNGYCARPIEMDCHFESICESCSFFVTTIEFKPTLQHQRDDALAKGQVGRHKIFDGLLRRLDERAG